MLLVESSEIGRPVPGQWRGRVLQLRVFAPAKDLRWQLRGLDEPWLALDPRALDVVTTGGGA